MPAIGLLRHFIAVRHISTVAQTYNNSLPICINDFISSPPNKILGFTTYCPIIILLTLPEALCLAKTSFTHPFLVAHVIWWNIDHAYHPLNIKIGDCTATYTLLS